MGVTVIRVPCPSWGSSFTLGFRGACFPFVLPWNVGKLISSALSRKILWPAVSWEGSLHEPRLPRAPFVHLPRSLFHTVSCSFLKRVPVSGGTVLAPVSELNPEAESTNQSCSMLWVHWWLVTHMLSSHNLSKKAAHMLTKLCIFVCFAPVCCFCPSCARPGSTQGNPLLWCHWHLCHCSLGDSKSSSGQLQGHLCACSRR